MHQHPHADTGQLAEPVSPRNIVANLLKEVSIVDDAEPSAQPVLLCEVCGHGARLYKCPRCAVHSCSLACCKQHKTENACNGKRDRTAYVATAAFDERALRSDFHFLEDVLQRRESAKRTLQHAGGGGEAESNGRRAPKRRKRSPEGSSTAAVLSLASAPLQALEQHPPAVQRLAEAARQRGVTLVVMPPGMSRRAANTSRYDAKADSLSWRLHCVFVASSQPVAPSQLLSNRLEGAAVGGLTALDGVVGMSLAAVRDSTLVGEVLSAFLDGGSVAGPSCVCTAAQSHALRHLRLARAGVRAFVQWIPSPAHDPLFVELDMENSLKAALRDKTVVEYPCLVFGRAEDLSGLRLRMAEVTPVPQQQEDAGEDIESDSDSDDGADFMQALQEMGGKDVSALRSIIREAEEG